MHLCIIVYSLQLFTFISPRIHAMKSLENTFTLKCSPAFSQQAFPKNISITQPSKQLHTFDDTQDHGFQGKYFQVSQNRESFAFWTIISILLVLTISNLILTLSIIGILHLSKGKIYEMEVIPEENIVKFYGESDLDGVLLRNVEKFEGFSKESVIIQGDLAPVHIRILSRNSQNSNHLVMDENGIQLRGVNIFEIKSLQDLNLILSTHRPHYKTSEGVNVLVSKTSTLHRIASPIDMPLHMSSTDARLSLRGSEGIYLSAERVTFQGESTIFINSTHGSIFLESDTKGIILDMEKMPASIPEMGLRSGSVQFKLCVCMPHGIVFRIAVPRTHNGSQVSCAHYNLNNDPCILN